VRRGLPTHLASLLSLPQHPDEHRLHRPILLAVDQELSGESLSQPFERAPMDVPRVD
jgi:hypothetical protein